MNRRWRRCRRVPAGSRLLVSRHLRKRGEPLPRPAASLVLPSSVSSNADGPRQPIHLRVEYRVDPVGIDVRSPRLSWQLDDPRRGALQTAYRVQVASSESALASGHAGLWDSGKVESDETIHVVYGGNELTSRTHCYWRVRVWDQDGRPSPWSESATWSMGLLDTADWRAQWIAADTYVRPPPDSHGNGYRSMPALSDDAITSVTIDLGYPRRIQAVRLWPARPVGVPFDAPGYLFPVRFRIEASNAENFTGATIVVDQTYHDFPNPGTEAPRFDFDPVSARYVRLTVTKLACRSESEADDVAFALAEIEVLNEGRNVALGQPATASDSFEQGAVWCLKNLTDGAVVSQQARREPQFLPAPMLRKEFHIDATVRRATAYVTALGCYELRINGRRVGDEILAPQWTHYGHRVLYQTYDVTPLIEPGDNAVGATIGDGWYRMRNPVTFEKETFSRCYGDSIKRLLMQIEVELADGHTMTIATNESWKSHADGPVRFTKMYDGVGYDAREEMDGWDRAGFDDSGWTHASVTAPDWPLTIAAQPNEPIRVVEDVHPVALTEPQPGVYMFDLGKNIAGRCRITVTGTGGTTVRLRHAEALEPAGTLYTTNLLGADATDSYTLKGDGVEVFEPPFTYHGFRYVEVTGLPSPPQLDSLVGRAFSSDTRVAGDFEASDETATKLWNAVVQTYRCNMPSVVTDCAGRDERLGWMGDGQVSWQTICFAMDVGAFGTKWTRDMWDSQVPGGLFNVVSPGARGFMHSPAWSDAGVIIPWTSYVNYGDRRLIEAAYEPARRYVEAVLRDNPDRLWRNNRGADFNDWLSAHRVSLGDEWIEENPGIPRIPRGVFATAFLANSARLLSNMADVLERDKDAARYRALACDIADAFVDAYVDDAGRIEGDTQSAYALALDFGLLDPEREAKAARRLAEKVAEDGSRLTTGIHSSKRMLRALSRCGRHDLAFHLVFRPEMPSWRYMLDNGATTIWERFDSYKTDRGFNVSIMNSLNHVGMTSVGEWLMGAIAGIAPDEQRPAGYKHFTIRPYPTAGLEWARGSYNSIRGPIASQWRKERDRFTLSVIIPANTRATVCVPTFGLSNSDITEGGRLLVQDGKVVEEQEAVAFQRIEGDFVVFEVPAGTYEFVVMAR